MSGIRGPAVVPIGMAHVRSRTLPRCWMRPAAPVDPALALVPHGYICGNCDRLVAEDRRAVTTGALQFIDSLQRDKMEPSEVESLAYAFEAGAKWLASQQSYHLLDLGLDMGEQS